MTSGTRVVWDQDFVRYDFGPEHPMAPIRLDLTARLAADLGLLEGPGVEVVGAAIASDETLALVHDLEYVAAVRAASQDPSRADERRGLGTSDDPAFAGMHDASARVVQASVDCAEAIWAGEVEHAVNFCGGLHHAMRDHASGFCVYNDVAAAIQRLLDLGAQRVAYVDVDVHHGDGTESLFWNEPRVLTISVHETGRILFPGTGFAQDSGGPSAVGTAINVPLPPGTGDAGWLRAIHSTVPALVRAFEPEVLVTQHGCDTHTLDPLAHLAVSVDAQRAVAATMHDLAHQVSGGRWLATGGGGYEIVDVVPRAWSHLIGIAAHRPVDPQTPVPQAWRDHVQERLQRVAPLRMSDGGRAEWTSWETGFDPEDPVDQAVMVTRRTTFPLHGLDPWFD